MKNVPNFGPNILQIKPHTNASNIICTYVLIILAITCPLCRNVPPRTFPPFYLAANSRNIILVERGHLQKHPKIPRNFSFASKIHRRGTSALPNSMAAAPVHAQATFSSLLGHAFDTRAVYTGFSPVQSVVSLPLCACERGERGEERPSFTC